MIQNIKRDKAKWQYCGLAIEDRIHATENNMERAKKNTEEKMS